MNFLKKLFGQQEESIKSNFEFWAWFQQHANYFFEVVKHRNNIEANFFNKLSPKLTELKEGYFYSTGMLDDNTAELIFTADGDTKNIVFVEELVASAPEISGWKFSALKPARDINDVAIRMGEVSFTADNLFFYSNQSSDYPDEIDISIVHNDLNEENKKIIINGVFIFLDNYLGELDFANNIDRLEVISEKEAKKELIPIGKLKDFLTWRQKEFVEKYDGIRYDIKDDSYAMMEAQLENGNMLVAVLNTNLLQWDRKVSHPWMSVLTVKFDGRKNNGMPDNADFEKMSQLEDALMDNLPDHEGYLNVGRQTASNERSIYFACKEFRKPSKVFYQIQKQNAKNLKIEFEIYKDKYWRTLEHFNGY